MEKLPTTDLNEIWNFTSEDVEFWVKEIQDELKTPVFKRPSDQNEEEHFENGHYLHSSQYFFAKKYFQSSNNCDKIAMLLAIKIKELNLQNVTLIGFRSYTGLLLSKTQSLLTSSDFEIDYAIIEQKKESEFTWQFIPDFAKLNENFVIVLPITCTCSTYIRLRKYIQDEIAKLKEEFNKQEPTKNWNWKVNDNFLNIFLIQEEELEFASKPIVVDSEKLSKIIEKENRKLSEIEIKLSKLYSGFNWERIEDNAIYFNKYEQVRFNKNLRRSYIGHPIIKLYSKLYLPEDCELCFPFKGKLASEKNIFPTHNNFETPNLLIGFPNFGTQVQTQINEDESKEFLFNNLFASNNSLGSSHLYGHIKVNESSYLNYIRGNTFYQQNRENILRFFNKELEKIIFNDGKTTVEDIVFITSESKHNSTFLDELTTNRVLSLKKTNGNFLFKVHILRFDAKNEFIDNFMSNYITLFQKSKSSILTIYFEEVMSAGLTFKLVSNYLKHYKHKPETDRQNRHGFDYIFSLIDRTPYYTKEELLKKLYSSQNENASSSFIYYFKLNVPIVAAAHLGNPLQENVKHLKNMILESHLDILKEKIGNELILRKAVELPEESILINKTVTLKFFPFETVSEEITPEILEVHKEVLTNGKLDLLKLYIAHQINTILSISDKSDSQYKELKDNQIKGNLIEFVINNIWVKILEKQEKFFSSKVNVENRAFGAEREIVKDTIIKILSRHPFTYYKVIYDSIFKYCLKEIEQLRGDIKGGNGKISFSELRRLKFFGRRLVELDSSYLISHDFISFMKLLFEQNDESIDTGVIGLINRIEENIKYVSLESKQDSKELLGLRLNNLYYKYDQVSSLSLFLIYSFKEAVFKNHYRSIKLEELVNSKKLLPKEINNSDNDVQATLRLIRDPYYLLTGMIKAENIYLLNELKNLHKRNFQKYLYEFEKYSIAFNSFKNNWNKLNLEGKESHLNSLRRLKRKVESDWPFDNGNSIANYYFAYRRNDPIILNANKFVSKSRYASTNPEYHELIKLAIAEMLQSATLLIPKNTLPVIKSKEAVATLYHDFVIEVRKAIQSIVRILQPGIEPLQIEVNGKQVELLPGSKESKLKYALCFEYFEEAKTNDVNANNIFVLSSEDGDTGARLETSGLIYNLLYGIYTSVERQSEQEKKSGSKEDERRIKRNGLQSLLVSIKSNNTFHSFNNEYIPSFILTDDNRIEENKQHKGLSFEQLYKLDCKNDDFDTGLSILNNAPLTLFFRLSDHDDSALSESNLKLNGRAILVVTFNDEPLKSNFLSFMSNEKVRLLLLIKEELLAYLQTKFQSNAFTELLKFKKDKEHKDSMGHMVKDYWLAIANQLDNETLGKSEIELVKFINQKIQTHLGAGEKVADFQNKNYPTYDEKKFKDSIEKLMAAPLLSDINYKKEQYELDIKIANPIKCHPILFEQVFAELIINMRRAFDLIPKDEKRTIKIYSIEDEIVFENNYNQKLNSDPSTPKQNGGKAMCIRILTKLDLKWKEHKPNENTFQIKIKLTNGK